jgi:aspartate aminotransferase
MKIQDRAKRFGTESAFKVLARARQLEAQGKNIVHLEIGQPDFPTPEAACEAGIQAIRDGQTGYSPTPGLPDLRQAIAQQAGELRGIDIDPDQVMVTPGGKPVLYYAINALAGEGDEVIYPDPAFPMYPSIIAHSGATGVPLRLEESKGFRFDPDEFRRLLSPRTSLIILNSPQNPTGGVLDHATLEVIAQEAKDRDIPVLSDEIYSRILYDEKFESIASFPDMAERTIILDGFSKTYAMTGWRLGYVISSKPLAEVFERYNVNIVSCVTTFAQFGAIEALRMDQSPVDHMVAEFRKRRDFLIPALNAIPGLKCANPGGAFYAFPNVTGSGIPSAEFADRLLDEAGVATLDGGSFGPGGEGYIRISYASSMENLEEACRRIANFLKS